MNPNQGVELRLCSKRAKGLFKLEKIGPRTQGGDFKNNQNGKDVRENNGDGSEIENDAVNSVLNVVAASSDDAEMEKTLTMVVSLGIALLRGMKGNQYIEDYLNAAIADTDNIVVVDRQRIN